MKRNQVEKMVVVALFAAICYLSLLFRIPIPSPVGKPFLHLGNLFVLLAAFLYGGMPAGLAGAVGMGLFDLANGFADMAPKTILLKFGIGILAGLVFWSLKKRGQRDNMSSLPLVVMGVLCANGAGVLAYLYYYKRMPVMPPLFIFLAVLALLLFLLIPLTNRSNRQMAYAAIAGTCAILFNIAGEFAFGIVEKMLMGSRFIPALAASFFSLPATVINGVFSIVAASLLYVPLATALKRIQS